MDVEIAIQIADTAVYQHSGQHLKDVEARILRGALQNQTYTEIFLNDPGYSESYIKRDVGPKLWKLLSEALKEPVTKKNLQEPLKRAASRFGNSAALHREPLRREDLMPQSFPTERLVTPAPRSALFPTPLQPDWGDAPGLVSLQGREDWLNTLSSQLLGTGGQRSPLQMLLVGGGGGMGKTALVRQLAEQVQPHFRRVVWRSLHAPPPLLDFLRSLRISLTPDPTEPLPADTRIADWLELLAAHRYLLILDGIESLFAPQRMAGDYRDDYENYQRWFTQICHRPHASCVIVIGREFPEELLSAARTGGDRVHAVYLPGLPWQVADASFNADQKLIATDANWRQLFDHYQGNPEILSRICGRIRGAIWENSVASFLEQLNPENSSDAVPQIKALLEEQLQRLSPQEREVMVWLAINQGLATSEDLRHDLVTAEGIDCLPDTLFSLQRRSLIIDTDHQFEVSPWIRYYTLEQFTQRIVQEIISEQPCDFDRYALIKNNVRESVRSQQYLLILAVIVEKLKKERLSEEEWRQKFERMLIQLRQTSMEGYGAGNVIHLCQELLVDLEGMDFSGLFVRQVRAQTISLRNTEFSHCTFHHCEWMEPLGDGLKIALSHHPSAADLLSAERRSRPSQAVEPSATPLLAIGDSQGRLCLWRVSDAHCLWTESRHRGAVQAIAFSPTDTHLATLGDDGIILWDLRSRQSRVLWDTSFSGRGTTAPELQCLRFHPDGTVLVAGDRQGNLWRCPLNSYHPPTRLSAHACWGAIQSLWFSPEATTLVAVLADESLLVWDWATGTASPRAAFRPNWEIKAIYFESNERFWAIAAAAQHLCLWDPQSGVQMSLPREHTSEIFALALHPQQQSAPLLLSSCSENILKLWDLRLGDGQPPHCLHSIDQTGMPISSLTWSGDGRVIAAAGTNRLIRLWQLDASSAPHPLKTLQGYTCPIRAIALNSDASLLAVGHEDGTIRLRDVYHGGAYLKTLKAHPKGVGAIAFSPHGQMLMSAGQDRTLKQWNCQTGTATLVRDRLPPARTLVCSPSGGLASIGEDDTLRVWAAPDPSQDAPVRLIPRILGPSDGSSDLLQFSPDGRLLARVDRESIQVWNSQTEQRQELPLRSPPSLTPDTGSAPIERVHGLCFDATGDRLALVDAEQRVWVWQLSDQTVERWSAAAHRIHAVFWDGQNQLLGLGSTAQTLQLWTLQQEHQGPPPWTLTDAPARVEHWCLSGDRRLLAIAHSPDEITLWDLENRYSLGPIRVDQPYERMNIAGATFSPRPQGATLRALGAVEL